MPRAGHVPMELAVVQGGPYCAPEYHSFSTAQCDKTFINLIRSIPSWLRLYHALAAPCYSPIKAWDP